MLSLILMLAQPCDLVITDKADWQRINDPDKRVFCVTPGEYDVDTIGVVRLLRDGTEKEPRYLIGFNPANPADQTHPARQPREHQSVIGQFALEADFWILDRLVVRDSPGSNLIQGDAIGNQLERLLIEGAQRTGIYLRESRDTVIRRCVMRDPVMRPGLDNRHIYMGPDAEYLTIEDCEFRNGTGTFALGPGSLGNVMIRNNDMYVTSDRRTDCKGNLDLNGSCSCSEMHIVFKATDLPGSQVLIEGNRMWGMRKNDSACASTGSPGHGINVGSSSDRSIRNVTIRNNILWDNHTNGIFVANFTHQIIIEDNVISGSLVGIQNAYGGAKVRNNLFVENVQQYVGTQIGFFGNSLIDEPDESESLCFEIRQWTGPEQKCIEIGKSQ